MIFAAFIRIFPKPVTYSILIKYHIIYIKLTPDTTKDHYILDHQPQANLCLFLSAELCSPIYYNYPPNYPRIDSYYPVDQLNFIAIIFEI